MPQDLTTPLRTEIPAQEQNETLTTRTVTTEMGAQVQFNEAFARIGDRERVHFTCITEMRGAYPDIALPADVEREDGDVFVTLPVGAFNAESLNGRTYSENAMRQMADQINKNRPGSNKGHIKDEDFGFHFEFPPVRWLAAVISNGIIYAKGRAQTEETRQYFINAKRDGARVGTSLYAWAQSDGDVVTNLELISLDLADPARVGIPMTAAVPAVSAEMQGDETPAKQPSQTEEQDLMDEKELTALQEQLTTAQTERASLQEQVKALTAVKEEHDALVALLGGPDKPVEALQKFLTEQIQTAVTEAAQACEIESVRALVIDMVMAQKPASKEQAAEFVRARLDSEPVKAVIAAAVQKEMGPAQRRGSEKPDEPDNGKKYVKYPEEATTDA